MTVIIFMNYLCEMIKKKYIYIYIDFIEDCKKLYINYLFVEIIIKKV